MRILSINNINQVAAMYTRELALRGHRTQLFEPSLLGGIAPLPIKLACMPVRLLDMRRIVDKLNTRHFDVLHIHWASYGVLGALSNVPFVVHCHGSDVRERLHSPFFRPVLANIFRRAAVVLCITPDLLPIARSVRSDALFSPAPIDTDRFAPGECDQSHAERAWTILLFARLDPEKGSDIAMQGITRFVKRHRDVRVQVLDWGPLRVAYKQRYGERFEFLPRVVPNKVHYLLRGADVIVGQVALGAIGLSELQAMSCARPVITSFRYLDAYPTPPPLCQAATAEEVDAHLEELFQRRDMGKVLGQRAREWVIENHGCQRLVAKMEALYQVIV